MYKKIWVLLLLPFHSLFAGNGVLTNLPKGYNPEEVGKRIAYHFANGEQPSEGKWIGYAETLSWNGALRFAEATNDDRLIKLLQKRFEPLFATQKEQPHQMNHVDRNMFGSLPLILYQITRETRYLDFGIPYADSQWEVPNDATSEEKSWAERGYSWQTRLWIDDMYMITIIQTQAYKVTGNRKYIERAAKEMAMYLDKLQRPNGLFYHAPDVPFFWCRGNGWMAAGMVDLLRYLPEDNMYRQRIMEGYHMMMESLKDYQAATGMWNQLIDEPDFWAETSGSAMFTYALITGVKQGWLDAREYAPVTRKAWIALIHFIDNNGDVTEVCVGTNKKNEKQYYYDRPRKTGDYHGQAPYLWCTAVLLENIEN